MVSSLHPSLLPSSPLETLCLLYLKLITQYLYFLLFFFWNTDDNDNAENPHSDKFALYTDPFYHTIFSKPRVPLSSVMLLNPVHFPSEILPKAAIEAAKASGLLNGASVSQSQVWKIKKSTGVDSNTVKELEKYQELENRDGSDNEQSNAKVTSTTCVLDFFVPTVLIIIMIKSTCITNSMPGWDGIW